MEKKWGGLVVDEPDENSGDTQRQEQLIGDIGLCMSGGGYRAAAFHLGTLAYLDRIGLTSHLSAISTVSGGSFTGAKYILSLIEKQTFDHFFSTYYQAIKMTNLVADGLAELASRKNQVASGRQDLVVSMAQVYAETLFSKTDSKGGPSKPYYFDTVLYGEQPVGDVVFNATDFRSGIAFRFQRSKNPKAYIGNFYNHIDVADAAKIRLADIVASSSCFPGGFEPLSFPYDFTWKEGEVPANVKQAFPFRRGDSDSANPRGPVALMDGGVFDNQGLQSLLMVDDRTENVLDLIVISDVDQPSLNLFEMPEPHGNGGLTLGAIGKFALTFILLCFVTLATIGISIWRDWGTADWLWGKFVFLYLIPFGLTTVAAGSICYLYLLIRDDVLPYIPMVGSRAWKSMRQLTIGQVRNMLRFRVASLLSLTSSIFMKRIRSLVYRLVYGEGSTKYDGKRVSNVIYTLAPSKTRDEPIGGIGRPSKVLNQVACVAFNQATTLWFDEDYEQPCLIASGQASLCYNLIKLFSRRYGKDPDLYSGEVKAMWESLKTDWGKFNEDPFFMLKDMVAEDWHAVCRSTEAVKCNWGIFEGETAAQSALN